MAKDAPKDQYNVLEAKTHLSRLLAEVEAGREITIARNGTAIAKVVPIRQPKPTKPKDLLEALRMSAGVSGDEKKSTRASASRKTGSSKAAASKSGSKSKAGSAGSRRTVTAQRKAS